MPTTRATQHGIKVGGKGHLSLGGDASWGKYHGS
jgi:hypothetical protein